MISMPEKEYRELKRRYGDNRGITPAGWFVVIAIVSWCIAIWMWLS